MVTEAFADAEKRMKGAVESLRHDLGSVRTGRAHPSLVANVNVEYYGSSVPLSQLASITTPEARLIVVQPWDRRATAQIERAIQRAELGLNPANDGNVLRVPVPPLTEERRKQLAKLVRQKAENGRVAVRNIRRDDLDRLRRIEKAKEISQDDLRRSQDHLQKLTDRYTAEIDRIAREKESEVMEV